jgi:hypothetical protein
MRYSALTVLVFSSILNSSFANNKQHDVEFVSESTQDTQYLQKWNPIDMLENLVKARVPIIHVVGDIDKVVPVRKTLLLQKKDTRHLEVMFKSNMTLSAGGLGMKLVLSSSENCLGRRANRQF